MSRFSDKRCTEEEYGMCGSSGPDGLCAGCGHPDMKAGIKFHAWLHGMRSPEPWMLEYAKYLEDK